MPITLLPEGRQAVLVPSAETPGVCAGLVASIVYVQYGRGHSYSTRAVAGRDAEPRRSAQRQNGRVSGSLLELVKSLH